MDYSHLTELVYTTLEKSGKPVAITRLGTLVGLSVGVIVKSESVNDSSSEISMLTTTQKTMLVGSTPGVVPQVGDDLTHLTNIYHINQVEEYNPAGTVIAYKVVMS